MNLASTLPLPSPALWAAAFGPAPPAPPPADDDAALLPSAPPAFLAAFFSAIHAGTVPIGEDTAREMRFAPPAHADTRWAAFWGSAALAAAMDWGGAATLLARHGDPNDRSYSSVFGLGEVVVRLERRVQGLLAAELDRFWSESDGAPPGALLTMENLALVWAINTVAAHTNYQLSRDAATRGLVQQALDLLRATGVPQHRDPASEPGWGLDDLHITGCWIAAHWAAASLDYYLAFVTGLPPIVDTPHELPHVPTNVPALWLGMLPPPSRRPANGPIPPQFLRPELYGIDAREYLGWICPRLDPPVGPRTRDTVLAARVRTLKLLGPAYVTHIAMYAAAKIAEFRGWLAHAAGLSVAEVLLAGEVVARLGILEAVDPEDAAACLPGLDAAHVGRLFRNPLLGEAVRRREHLEAAVSAIRDAMPPEVTAAEESGDYAQVCSALPLYNDAQRVALLNFLIHLRQLSLSLLSPEPLEDRGALLNPASPPGDDASAACLAWSRLPPFRRVLHHARSVSRTCALLARHAPHLANSIFAPGACRAAIAAAYVHLAALRGTDPSLRPAAARDLAACTSLLEASGLDHAQPARILLRRLAEGEDVRPTRADARALRVAGAACTHLPRGERMARGGCWGCVVEGGEGDGEEDPMLEIPAVRRGSSGLLGRGGSGQLERGGSGMLPVLDPGEMLPRAQSWSLPRGRDPGPPTVRARSRLRSRSVRFAEEVAVFETHSRDSYPGRSMHAPEGADGEHGADAGVPMAQRGIVHRVGTL